MLNNRQHRDTNKVSGTIGPDNCLKAVLHSGARTEVGVQGGWNLQGRVRGGESRTEREACRRAPPGIPGSVMLYGRAGSHSLRPGKETLGSKVQTSDLGENIGEYWRPWLKQTLLSYDTHCISIKEKKLIEWISTKFKNCFSKDIESKGKP